MKSGISIEQANTLTGKHIVFPVLLSAAALFVLFYGRFDFSFAESAKHIGFWPWMLRYTGWVMAFVAAVAAGIFVHEGIHGLFIAMFARGGFSSLSFGYDKKTMSPYAHSKVPLRVWQMTVVCLSPLFFMGLLPFAAALYYGSLFTYLFSVVFIITAGGDIIYARLLLKVPPRTLVEDLPDAVGFKTTDGGDK